MISDHFCIGFLAVDGVSSQGVMTKLKQCPLIVQVIFMFFIPRDEVPFNVTSTIEDYVILNKGCASSLSLVLLDLKRIAIICFLAEFCIKRRK